MCFSFYLYDMTGVGSSIDSIIQCTLFKCIGSGLKRDLAFTHTMHLSELQSNAASGGISSLKGDWCKP